MQVTLYSASSIRGLISVVLAVSLLLAFGLHSVQIKHTHFVPHTHAGHTHEHQEGHSNDFAQLDVVMHMADKKLFLFLILGFLAVVPFFSQRTKFLALLASVSQRTKSAFHQYGQIVREHSYLSLFFRKGIFHTKAF